MGDLADIDAVEKRTGHSLSRTHFLGIEGAKQSATDNWWGYPLFWQSKEDGSGNHIVYGKFGDDFYLAKRLLDPSVREPIQFARSRRNSE